MAYSNGELCLFINQKADKSKAKKVERRLSNAIKYISDKHNIPAHMLEEIYLESALRTFISVCLPKVEKNKGVTIKDAFEYIEIMHHISEKTLRQFSLKFGHRFPKN